MSKWNGAPENKILNTLSKSLPDDRPITSIQIVESVEKCPWGFLPISRTHDQDQDADLWREGSFLKRKSARYLCLSKSEGLPDFVVQQLIVLSEKSAPPEGYSLLHRTADSEQKAWRKKQLCYRLARKRDARQAVTDIIVCSRLKKAPEGFNLAGEINGLTVCFKMGNVQDSEAAAPAKVYPKLDDSGNGGDYEILAPVRPAPPRPPPPPFDTNEASLGQGPNSYLDGVPFVLNPSMFGSSANVKMQIPVITARSEMQLNRDYCYDFTVEKQVT